MTKTFFNKYTHKSGVEIISYLCQQDGRMWYEYEVITI
jgi:hypothetical protein